MSWTSSPTPLSGPPSTAPPGRLVSIHPPAGPASNPLVDLGRRLTAPEASVGLAAPRRPFVPWRHCSGRGSAVGSAGHARRHSKLRPFCWWPLFGGGGREGI